MGLIARLQGLPKGASKDPRKCEHPRTVRKGSSEDPLDVCPDCGMESYLN